MAHAGAKLNILLVCPWILRVPGLRASLAADAIDADIARVDFDAALRVALARSHFHLAIYVPTPGLPFDVAQSLIKQHKPEIELVKRADLEEVLDEIRRIARTHRS